MKASVRSSHLPSLAAGAIACVAYLATMNRTVTFIDSGELAAVASTLGVAHPTGYPLFTLLGRIAALVPLGGEEIYRLNLLSAILVAISVSLFARLIMIIDAAPHVFPAARKTRTSLPRYAEFAAVFGASLSFGFVSTVWAQSVAVEVYALHLFFLVLILFLFIKGIEAQHSSPRTLSRELLLGSYLLGLSFSNHFTTILVVPGVAALLVMSFGWKSDTRRRLVQMVPLFLLGLSTYLYLPIRSASRPLLDWGFTNEFGRLIWHISGKQYRSWIFSGVESASRQAKYFVSNLPGEFHLVVLGLALIGLALIVYRTPRLAVILVLLFLVCVGYAINYDIHDIDSYFLLAYVVLSICVAVGIRGLLEYVHRKRTHLLVVAVVLVALGTPTVQWYANRRGVDESENRLVHDYTLTILNQLKQDALVISYQWDYFVSAALYFQHVRGIRPDVTIIDKELLRRSWYFKQVESIAPSVVHRSQERIDAFLRELYKFEHDIPYSPQIIESRFVEMINDLIDQGTKDRPVYVGPEIELNLGGQYERVPEGLLLRLLLPGERGEFQAPEWPIVPPPTRMTRLTLGLLRQYAIMSTLVAEEFLRKGDHVKAREWAERALGHDPGFLPAQRLLKSVSSR